MDKQIKKIRIVTIIFMVFLILSGLTAIPLEWELSLVNHWFEGGNSLLADWYHKTYNTILGVNSDYPVIIYGFDWLAFAHIVIATVFIGPIIDPIRSKWIYVFGMLACVMVFPFAFIMGEVRGIPIFWRLIDCSFGILGLIPLIYCYKKIQLLEKLKTNTHKLKTL